MSLLREIQDAAIDGKSDITTLLRKCKVLATRLGNDQFKSWVDWELSGYPSKESLPDYRVLHVQSFGHFSGPFGSGMRNAPIAPSCIDEVARDLVDKIHNMAPISSIADLIREPDGSGSFKAHWPADLIAMFADKIYQNQNCLSAWQVVPRGQVVAIVDAVRNRILNFVLEIEVIDPAAGEALPGKHPIAEEKIAQVFHNHIYGNVGNIASGSANVVQTATIEVHAGDIDSLKRYLAKQGVPKNDIAELETAIASDGELQPSTGLGKKVSDWVGKTIAAA